MYIKILVGTYTDAANTMYVYTVRTYVCVCMHCAGGKPGDKYRFGHRYIQRSGRIEMERVKKVYDNTF